MQCPNCKMGVADGAKMCLHCGAVFQTVEPQPVQNAPTQPVQNAVQGGNPAQQVLVPQTDEEKNREMEECLLAYYGEKKYQQIKNAKFSFGTLCFGFVWLLYERLYQSALGEAIKTIGLVLVTGILYYILYIMGKIPSSGVGIPLIIAVILFIWILYKYASDFSFLSLKQVKKEISEMDKKARNKEEKIALCKQAYKKNYWAFLLIPLMIGGAYLTFVTVKNTIETRKATQEEFDEESGTLFKTTAILAHSGILLSEGNRPTSDGIYYVLIDSDKKDKEHPFSSSEEKDKGLFDGKGYIMISMGGSVTNADGLVCLNNGDSKKRYISLKSMNIYELIREDSHNSFENIPIDKKGECDITEFIGALNYPLHQLTLKEE